jgi:hypothetical protein
VIEMGRQPRTGVPFSFQDPLDYIPHDCTAERLAPTDLIAAPWSALHEFRFFPPEFI